MGVVEHFRTTIDVYTDRQTHAHLRKRAVIIRKAKEQILREQPLKIKKIHALSIFFIVKMKIAHFRRKG